MGTYLNRLDVTPQTDGKIWVVLAPFGYRTDGGVDVIVPLGFRTNFVSVPRAFWSFISPWGDHGFGAVVHDWLYSDQSMSRKEADEVILEAMKQSGVGAIKRYTIFRALRIFGRFAWKENQRRRSAGVNRVGPIPTTPPNP